MTAVLGGSFILLITFNIFNVLNFLFQFSMARMLTAAEYGVLATLFSVIYIMSIFSESIQTIVTKYTAHEENSGKIHNLLNRALKTTTSAASVLFAVYLLLAIALAPLLAIPYPLLALNGLIIFVAFTLPVTRGILQGRKAFTSLGINFIVESLAKILLAIALVAGATIVFPDIRVYGAVSAIIVGGVLAFAFSWYALRSIIASREQPMKTPTLYASALPIFFVTLAVVGFYSVDVIIARIVFTPEVAGAYAIAAVLAKAVFWGTIPISKAMFPLTAGTEKGKKKNTSPIFTAALLLLLSCLAVILLIIYLFPQTIVSVFSGKILGESVQILFPLSIAMSLLALSNCILLYKLSQGKTRGALFLVGMCLVEAALLLTSGGDLLRFSYLLISAAALFFITSLIVVRK